MHSIKLIYFLNVRIFCPLKEKLVNPIEIFKLNFSFFLSLLFLF
uniref:Uncharacterized protein n=1 Tax=Meloidogyne enterolobii TaxID=390850 RepID=A0A6V7TIE3_MELEN|nr:unnamed protein product [Meloidogyne enterolobii]